MLVTATLYVWLTVAPRDAAAHAFWYGLGCSCVGVLLDLHLGHVFGNAPRLDRARADGGPRADHGAGHRAYCGWPSAACRAASRGCCWWRTGPAWVLVEWVRGWVPDRLSVDGVRLRPDRRGPLAGWAPVLGVYGVSFMLVLSAGGHPGCAHAEGRRACRLGAVAVIACRRRPRGGMVAGSSTGRNRRYGEGRHARRSCRLAVSTGQEVATRPAFSRRSAHYREKPSAHATATLVVWPRSPFRRSIRVERYIAQLERDARAETGRR